MKSLYYQFVNIIQNMDGLWFGTIWCLLAILSLVSFLKIWKSADAEKRIFKKPAYLIPAILFFILLVVLTSLRK